MCGNGAELKGAQFGCAASGDLFKIEAFFDAYNENERGKQCYVTLQTPAPLYR